MTDTQSKNSLTLFFSILMVLFSIFSACIYAIIYDANDIQEIWNKKGLGKLKSQFTSFKIPTFLQLLSQWGVGKRQVFLNRGAPIARITSVKGDVQRSMAGDVNWENVNINEFLYADDRIFTGDGTAIVQYHGLETARVLLSERSVFVVRREMPVSFNLAKSIKAPIQGSNRIAFEKKIQHAKTNFKGGIQLEVEIHQEQFTTPRGNVFIQSVQWPVSVVFGLTPGLDKKYRGILWEKKEKSEEIWRSLEMTRNFEISIPAPGKYVFQGFSDSLNWRTAAISIESQDYSMSTVSQTKLPLLPTSLNPGDVLVIP